MEQSYTQKNPYVIYRSKQLILSTETYFSCNSTQTTQYIWSQTQFNSMNNTNNNLLNNPTVNSSCLVIQPNTLSYGLYQFTFSVKITLSLDGSLYVNNISTFVLIVPTEIVVNALKNGVQSLLIGSNQTLIFNPSLYSIDLDNIVSPYSLSFLFYCQIVSNDSTSLEMNNFELHQYKMNSTMIISSNQTCFESNGNC